MAGQEAAGAKREALKQRICSELNAKLRGCNTLELTLKQLGMPIEGDWRPTLEQIHKAYKRAAMLLHPDKHASSSLEDQVRAEETFKIISKAHTAQKGLHAIQVGSRYCLGLAVPVGVQLQC